MGRLSQTWSSRQKDDLGHQNHRTFQQQVNSIYLCCIMLASVHLATYMIQQRIDGTTTEPRGQPSPSRRGQNMLPWQPSILYETRTASKEKIWTAVVAAVSWPLLDGLGGPLSYGLET